MNISLTLPVVSHEPFRALNPKDSLSPGDLFHGTKKEQETQEKPHSSCSLCFAGMLKAERNRKGIDGHYRELDKGKPFRQSVLTNPYVECPRVLTEKNKPIGK